MGESVIERSSVLQNHLDGTLGDSRCLNSRRTDVQRLQCVLNIALAAELAGLLRYKQIFSVADRQGVDAVANDVLVLSCEEQEHVDALADRIVQLGGEPRFSFEMFTKNGDAVAGPSIDLEVLLRECLEAERVAIGTYVDIISWLGECDAMTGSMLKQILAAKEERAQDLLDLFTAVRWCHAGSTPSSIVVVEIDARTEWLQAREL
jgi:bacterioferritin